MTEIKYYKKDNGSYPVREFINNLDVKMQSKTQVYMEMLAIAGSELWMPYSRHLVDHLCELRVSRDGIAIRLLYFFNKERAIFTNGFVKKTKTTPLPQLQIAKTRRDHYLKKRNPS